VLGTTGIAQRPEYNTVFCLLQENTNQVFSELEIFAEIGFVLLRSSLYYKHKPILSIK
jgi:hypothetical protein